MGSTEVLKSIKLMAILLYHQQMLTKLAAINVALNVLVRDCKNNQLSDVIVDGNKDPKNYVDIEGDLCQISTFIEIFLNGTYDIHYVVVYAGEGTKPDQLDYFKVLLYGRNRYFTCADYPGKSIISHTGMRVNCQSLAQLYSRVMIQSQAGEGLSLTEVEVHTLATLPVGMLAVFQGCLKHFQGSIIENEADALNVSYCQEQCFFTGHIFFALKAEGCYCNSDFMNEDEAPPEYCNLLCNDGHSTCGGNGLYSLYLVRVPLPHYRGCFSNRSYDEDFTKVERSMTIEKCLRHCSNYTYALLREGNVCSCNNNADITIQTLRDQCTTKCAGNANEFCGGEKFVSIYETCLAKYYPSNKCSKFLHCEYDKYGDCKNLCEPGYTGDHCFERYLKVTRNIVTKTSSTIRTISTKGSVPATSTTTTKDSATTFPSTTFPSRTSPLRTSPDITPKVCKDPNLCKNIENAVCVVIESEELCDCMIGYSRIDPTTCSDIDECQFYPCDHQTANCFNMNGSYNCICKPGYINYMSKDICIIKSVQDPIGEGVPVQTIPVSVLIILPVASTLILATLFCWKEFQPSGEGEAEEGETVEEMDKKLILKMKKLLRMNFLLKNRI